MGCEVTDPNEQLAAAEKLNDAMRDVSDLLNGAVSTLKSEGWTEEQARELIVAQYLAALRAVQ